MKPSHGGMTTHELIARNATDPAYQAMRRARDEHLAEIAAQRRLEQRSLLNDLEKAGTIVDWVGRLCEAAQIDNRIYPIILDHLTRDYSPWLLEWIGRAFGRKSARPIVWDTLVELIRTKMLTWPATEGTMAAISAMATPRDLPTLIALLSDRSLGSNRIYLVQNLMRSKRPEARAALHQHKDDPDLAAEIGPRLARIRDSRRKDRE